MRRAFARAEKIPLRQDFPEGDAEAAVRGIIRIGWSGRELHILAELDDEKIVTSAVRRNQLLHLLGDSFEIFLKAPEHAAYLEFQIAPNNVVLQLLFPSHPEFVRQRHLPEPAFMARFGLAHGGLASRIWADTEARYWTVLAAVDLRLLLPSIESLGGHELEFNFGRYDYASCGGEPVLSCSSVLSRLDFHSIAEWGRLILEAENGVPS